MLREIKKVLIAAGGTGGHLFPAIALAEKLSSKGVEVIFVCSDRPRDRQILEKEGYRFFILKAKPLQKGLYKSLIFILWLAFGCLQSNFILLKFRPQVCVGFGGYSCVPLIILAKILGMRTVIHEQNLFPGRANRILANFVKKILISFEETKDFFPIKKTVLTGNPVRKVILNSREEDAYRFTGLDRAKNTILVVGGSQGSHKINTILPEAFFLIDRNLRENFQIIHLAGESEVSLVEGSYHRCGLNYRVFGFSDKIGLFYRISKLIIARAGATTIAEIIAMGVPAILIPYPYANGHQRLNAKFLEQLGAAIILEEDRISARHLAQTIVKLFTDSSILLRLKSSLKRLENWDASERICKEVLN